MLTSLAIKKMQIKTITLNSIAVKIKDWKITSIGEDVKKLEYSYTPHGNVKWHSCFGKHFWQVLKTLHIELTYDLVIPLLGNVNICPQKNLYTNVHSNIIHNGPKVKIIQISINWCLDKQNMTYPNYGILFDHEKKYWYEMTKIGKSIETEKISSCPGL